MDVRTEKPTDRAEFIGRSSRAGGPKTVNSRTIDHFEK